MNKIIDAIVNRIVAFFLKNRPTFVDYLLEKVFWTFRYIPDFFANKKFFEDWEKLGWHITEANFYQPIPELLKLRPDIWKEKIPMFAVNVDKNAQLDLAKKLISRYKNEFNLFPFSCVDQKWTYFVNNNNFTSIDGEIYYSLIRFFKPKTILEVGSGFSSFVAYKAIKKNNSGNLICVEPYPRDFFLQDKPTEVRHLKLRLEELEFSLLDQLHENDILFIDSSHILKLGSDVSYIFFNILPRLNKGVIVHFHDVFLPFHYPEQWAKENRYFWNEQYILLSFLMYNTTFKILLSNSMVHYWDPDLFQKNLNSYREFETNPGSIWLRKEK